MVVLKPSLLIGILLLVVCAAENWIGPGRWEVTGAESCDNPEQYPFTFDLSRKKINRTHDGISAHFVFPDALDDSIGIKINVCTYVDGGCKPFRAVNNKCFREFCYKYVREAIRDVFQRSGIDPPDFPVKAGEYKMEEYLLNYEELPSSAAYGVYRATVSLTKDSLPVSCHVVLIDFNEIDE